MVLEALRREAVEQPLRLTVRGHCMEPVLPAAGDLLVSGARRYWPGDIVVFRSAAGDLRAHRLIGYRWRQGKLLLQMRADATATIDSPVGGEMVIGRVIGAPEPIRISIGERILAVLRWLRLLSYRIGR